MIILYTLFLVAGIISFIVLSKLGLPARISISLAVFILPSVLVTFWVLKIGDKPPPDAKTVHPQSIIESPKEFKK